MQANAIVVSAHMGQDWSRAYTDIVRNLCNAGIVAKHSSLKRMAEESHGLVIEKRLEIVEKIAKERSIQL